MKAIYYLAFITLFLCTYCCKKKEYQKRYPEDTEDTYDTPEKRMCDKWWTLNYVSFNEVDYTDSVKDSIGVYNIYFGSEDIKKFSSFHKEGAVNVTKPLLSYTKFNTVWYWSEDAEGFSIGDRDGIFKEKKIVSFTPLLFYTSSGVKWKILKLSRGELKIQVVKNDTIIINRFNH